jgi:membrane protein required for colicin V production
MPIDFIYLVLLVWFMMKGYRKGLVFAAFSLAAVLIAMLGALKFSHKLSAYLFNEQSSLSPWIPMLSYLVVFIAIVFIINMIARTIDKGLKTVKLGWVNKMAGALVYGIIVTFVWSSVLWLADKVSLIRPETKAGSKTYAIVEPFAAKGFDIIGKVLPFVKESYTELGSMFDKVNNHLP